MVQALQMIPFLSSQMHLLVLDNHVATPFHKHLILSSIMSIESDVARMTGPFQFDSVTIFR